MYKAYKFRLYPNHTQKALIHKTFGCYRFVYNFFLDKCKIYGYQKAFDMIYELKEMYISYPWLKEVDSCSLRCAIFNLEDAYKRFFSKRSGYPTFKSKYKRQTYRTNCMKSEYKGKRYSSIEIDINSKKIKLPKLGLVDIRGYRNKDSICGNIINATIIFEATGKYYVSVIVDEEKKIEEKVKPQSIVGIDLGIKDIVVTSSGEKYKNPKEIKKYETRIKRVQRKLSRQIKRSNNYYKTKRRLARLYEKLKNSRKYNIIKIVNKIVEEYDIIVSEKLKIQEMSKSHLIAKNLLDASFHKICEMINWKCMEKGKYYYQVDSYFPSSKLCSHCGSKTEKTKELGVREWECEECGSINDRDINASINIMMEGLKYSFS
ncbi:MAG: transposase [Bacilli bacterium]|nr:transposase [Bacilli bacterium]